MTIRVHACSEQQLYPNATLNPRHRLQKLLIVVRAVGSMMHTSVARRAESDHISRIIRPPVAHSPYVMRLQVGCAICTSKWRFLFAPFAVRVCTRQYVVSHVFTALKYSASRLLCWGRSGGRESSATKFLKIARYLLDAFLNAFNDAVQRMQFENDCSAITAVAVNGFAPVPAGTNVFPAKSNVARLSFVFFLKPEQVFSLRYMFDDGSISTGHLHIAILTFSEVVNPPIVIEIIIVAECSATLPGHDENDTMLCGGNYSALRLPSKAGVNVSAPIVGLPAYKSPGHTRPLRQPTKAPHGATRKGAVS